MLPWSGLQRIVRSWTLNQENRQTAPNYIYLVRQPIAESIQYVLIGWHRIHCYRWNDIAPKSLATEVELWWMLTNLIAAIWIWHKRFYAFWFWYFRWWWWMLHWRCYGCFHFVILLIFACRRPEKKWCGVSGLNRAHVMWRWNCLKNETI